MSQVDMDMEQSKPLAPMDPMLIGLVLTLLTFSTIMIASASMAVANDRFGNPLRITGHWLVYVPMGLTIIWGVSRIELSWLKAATLNWLLPLALLLMVLVLIPGLGLRLNGAQRWFSFLGFTLQPVELVKPVVILYMAYYLSSFPERLGRFRQGVMPMLLVLGVFSCLLLLQPDFGSTMLIIAVTVAMWFLGGVPLRHMSVMVVLVVAFAAIAIAVEPYRVTRFLSFTHPWDDKLNSGYQLVQSMIAYGSGGLTGVGLGQGVQKLFYLPEAFTDFIVAVIGEELGLVGTLSLVLLFALLIGRCFHLATKTDVLYERLVVLGCTMMIAVTFIINLGASSGLLPTKGMPMPFISYGGSALFGNCLLVGLILSVQRHLPVAHSKTKSAEYSPRMKATP
ncbi:MAG: putative lipid II flippase FtsW [Mariprofundales bacterium]|nr:putative lipid II flippase FtsW [Mariprofundales bacterium]